MEDFIMANTRPNDPIDDMFERIAYELAVYLKLVNQTEFDQVLDTAHDTYTSRRRKWRFWTPIYWYTRQRGIEEGDSASERIQKIFSKGKWKIESLNTILMRRLIEQIKGWGPQFHEKMAELKMDIQKAHLTIKERLIANIEVLKNVDAVSKMDESEAKLKQLEDEYELKQANLAQQQQSLTLEREKLLKELADIQQQKKAVAEELSHAQRIVAGFQTMTPEVNAAVLRVMRFAGLDYMAEMTKQKDKSSEINAVCAASSEARMKLVMEKQQEAEFLEKQKQEKVQELMKVCNGGDKDKFRQCGAILKQFLDKKAGLYGTTQSYAEIPSKTDYAQALQREIGEVATPDGQAKLEEKPKVKVRRDFDKLFPELAQMMGSMNQKIKEDKKVVTKKARVDLPAATDKENVNPAPAVSKPKTFQDVTLADGSKISVPVPPPPPKRCAPSIPTASLPNLPPVESLGPPPLPPQTTQCSSMLFAQASVQESSAQVVQDEVRVSFGGG